MKRCIELCVVASVFASSTVHAQPFAGRQSDEMGNRKQSRLSPANTTSAPSAPLTSATLEIATRVLVGTVPCELGQVVVLTPDPAASGFFELRVGKMSYRVSPEETTTGAIRLEDKAAGIVWLQLANKSMLMSQKLGKRLADECISPTQKVVAQAMLQNPPPSILDAPTPAGILKLAVE